MKQTNYHLFDFLDFDTELKTVGMVIPGIVTNITGFGAFVDVGVKQDGLVHISEIADRYVTDPAAELVLNQQVMVKVVQVEPGRKRIGLSIRQAQSKD